MSSKQPGYLSADEYRRQTMELHRSNREQRLEKFRHTGQVLTTLPGEVPSQQVNKIASSPAAKKKSIFSVFHGNKQTDKILLGVEIAAVVLLFGLVINGLSIIQTLNQEATSAIQLPTVLPTALINAVILPSGHTPPNSAQGAQPNVAEIPEHLRALVPALENIPLPTSSPQQGIRIQIPSLNIDAPIVQGDGWEQLKKGVAQHLGTPNPGEGGNLVFSAHNDIFGEIFRNLDQLKPGDTVIVFTNSRQYTYMVTGSQIVEPTRVDVMAPTPNSVVTLISCYPYMIDNKRIVVSAVLQNP